MSVTRLSMSLLTKPNPYPSNPRGRLVCKGHTRAVNSVAFSPDGGLVVSGAHDHTIRYWDSNIPSQRSEPMTGHTAPVRSVSYSPLGDMIASGSEDRTIRLWDTHTGQQVGAPLRGHHDWVRSVAFSPSAKLISSGSNDHTIRLWDAQHRKPIPNPLISHTDCVRAVAFSPDGTRLVSGSGDLRILVWDVELGQAISAPYLGHSDQVSSVAFSPDSSMIISCSWDQTLRLWDVRSGGLIGNPYTGHTDHVFSVAFSPAGTHVVSGSKDGTVRIWDLRTGIQVGESFRYHKNAVYSIAYSPCGKRIASGSWDKTVMLWSSSSSGIGAEHESEKTTTERSRDEINQQMSIQDMLDLLSRHGCVDLQATSQMDPDQSSAVLLSGGGFGDIWKGQLLNGTKVAIKTWRASMIEHCDYKMLKRATREIHYWSKMKHQNVHQLMGIIPFRDQSLGMVSEWMENGNLHEYLRRNPSVNRLQLAVQVASGIAYVHDHNIVHGDIKALNVLVSSTGIAKLTDFGLSTMTESSVAFSATTTSQAGSIRWMAPELLLEGSQKSKESDIYALGMNVLEIFTGAMPYSECRWDPTVTMRVMQGILPIRPLLEFKDDEPGNLIWNLLVSCWDKEPKNRPSGKHVVERLKA